MNKELKNLILEIYDEKINNLKRAKEEFCEKETYFLISPQEIFSAFCRKNPQIPAGELVDAYRKRYFKRSR